MFQDPGDYQDLMSAGSFFVVVAIMAVGFLSVVPAVFFGIRMIKGSMETSRLLTTGEAAQARVIKIWETGATVNDNPPVGFLLEVYPVNRPAYQAETKSLVSRLQIPRVQPGAIVPVKFDSRNHLKIALAP